MNKLWGSGFKQTYYLCVNVGFKHNCCVGNNWPDIHLSWSPTPTHPLAPLYSPTKHHWFFDDAGDVWIGLVLVSGSGWFGAVVGGWLIATSILLLESDDLPLALTNNSPTDWTVSCAISIPTFDASAKTSDDLSITVPDAYPKSDNPLDTTGLNILMIYWRISPKIVNTFIPKSDKNKITTKIIIIIFLKEPLYSLICGGDSNVGLSISII